MKIDAQNLDVHPARPDEVDAVLALARSAAKSDGVAALNEESLFALERLAPPARVLVASREGSPVGVLVDAQSDASGCDLVTAPDARRAGVARALLVALDESRSDTATPVRLWAHGDLPAAQAFAASLGARKARELWRMTRPLTADETFDVALPAGLVARGYDGSEREAQAWVDLNARAFAHHPEQGRMTLADFREREAQEWFDPAGLILVWDEASGELVASHWTKHEPGDEAGEVYVVAVAPECQGRGIAGPLTALGLAHLRDAGASSVELYVEGDNEPAKATYARRGFVRAAHDVMYVHTPARAM